MAILLSAAASLGGGGRVLELKDPLRCNLAPYLEVLAEPPGGLSIDQVASPPWSERFQPLGKPVFEAPSPELQSYWLRFSLAAAPGSKAARTAWLLSTDYIFLCSIELFRPGFPGWEATRTGICFPFATRELANRNFVFTLPGLTAQPAAFYLRLETKGLNPIGFHLRPLPEFAAHTAKEDYLFGICFGVLAGMILYNLFIAASLRDRTYFHYVGYMFFALLSLAFLHGHAMALVDLSLKANIAMIWTSMGLYTSFAYLFMRGALNTKSLSPLVDRLMLFGVCYGAAIAAAGLANQTWLGRWLTLGSGIFSPWLALWAGIASLRRGFPAARFFLIAWGALALAVGFFAAWEMGFLRGCNWAENALAMGTALESLLLSLALAARIRRLRQEREALTKSERRLKKMSYTDSLTSLYNKRFFSLQLEKQIKEAADSGIPLCLLFMDLDDFKGFNDAHGHDQGDLVLKGLARVLTRSLRAEDLPCRWGGEEFAVIIPGADLNQAAAIAERIRLGFNKLAFNPLGAEVHSTLSLGLAQALTGEGAAELIRRADQALYQAKQTGKNRLCVSS